MFNHFNKFDNIKSQFGLCGNIATQKILFFADGLKTNGRTYTVEYSNTVTPPTITATDEFGVSLTVTQGGDTIDFDTVGLYTQTYTASDSYGNTRTINYRYNVVDTVAPILSSNTQTFVVEINDSITYPTITANDAYDGVVAVNQSGTVDNTTLGDYDIVYSAIDSSGNTSSITHTYSITDTIAPIMSSNTITFTTTVGTPLTLETVTATDNSGESISVSQSGTVDFNTIGSYDVVYTASDSSGNSSSITHTLCS